jgi:O-antigen/teichoic acid export membrane protein
MLNITDINNKIFRNATWLFGDKSASSIFIAIQTVITAKMLGVNNYGLLVLVITYVDIVNELFDFNVWEAAIKYIGGFWESGEEEKTRSMIKFSYLIDISSGILAFAIAIAVSKLISKYVIHSPTAYKYIWIYSFCLLIESANSTSIAILRVFNKYRRIAFIRSSQALFRLVIVSILLLSGLGIKGVLFGYIAGSFMGFCIRMVVIDQTLTEHQLGKWWSANLNLIRNHLKGITWFLGNTNLAATVRIGEDKFFGILILGYFSGKEAVAFYNVATSTAKIVNFIVDPLYEALYPDLVKIKTISALQDIQKVVKDITKKLMIIIVPIIIIVFIFSGSIIKLIFGIDYIPASNILRIVALAALIARSTFWINPVLLTMGKPGLRTILGLVSTSSYLVLLFMFVPPYSYKGAGFAYLGFSVVKSSVALYISGNLFKSAAEK